MRLYPDLAVARRRQIRSDLLVAACLALFAGLAWLVRDAVLLLTVISTGFTDGAGGVQESLATLGGDLAGLPLVGDELQDAVLGLSEATAGNAVAAGESVTSAVTATANTLALVTFTLPAFLLLMLWLPRRLARARAWAAASTALAAPTPPVQLLALRALCQLPLQTLTRATPRPFEAYQVGDYGPLVRALYEHEGVSSPDVRASEG